MFVVTVTFEIAPGHLDAFLNRVRQQAADSLAAEPHCHRFDVCVGGDPENRVFLYEIYRDRGAFDDHLSSAHFLAFDSAVTQWVTSKLVQFWQQVDAVGFSGGEPSD